MSEPEMSSDRAELLALRFKDACRTATNRYGKRDRAIEILSDALDVSIKNAGKVSLPLRTLLGQILDAHDELRQAYTDKTKARMAMIDAGLGSRIPEVVAELSS